MPHQFISGREVWPKLTKLSRAAARSHIAVSYFTDKDSDLLFFNDGDRLVVNLSKRSLKSGATNPHALYHLLDKGVSIYNAPHLHAKTFLFGRTLVVGSANVSETSAKHHDEACLVTTDTSAIAKARQFIQSLATPPFMVHSDYLDECANHYRAPTGLPGTNNGPNAPQRCIWYIPSLYYEYWSEEEDLQADAAIEASWEPRMTDDRVEPFAFSWTMRGRLPEDIELGDLLILRTKDRDTGKHWVCRPLPFLRIEPRKRNGETIGSFIIAEKPLRMPDVPYQEFLSALSPKSKRVFGPGARLKAIHDPDIIDSVTSIWTPTGRLRLR